MHFRPTGTKVYIIGRGGDQICREILGIFYGKDTQSVIVHIHIVPGATESEYLAEIRNFLMRSGNGFRAIMHRTLDSALQVVLSGEGNIALDIISAPHVDMEVLLLRKDDSRSKQDNKGSMVNGALDRLKDENDKTIVVMDQSVGNLVITAAILHYKQYGFSDGENIVRPFETLDEVANQMYADVPVPPAPENPDTPDLSDLPDWLSNVQRSAETEITDEI